MLLAIGAIVLANSRPYEGLLVCGPAAVAIFWEHRRTAAVAVAKSGGAVGSCADRGGLMAYYNQRVFGSALHAPL